VPGGGKRVSAPTLTAAAEMQRTASVSVPHHEEMRGSTTTWPPHSWSKEEENQARAVCTHQYREDGREAEDGG